MRQEFRGIAFSVAAVLALYDVRKAYVFGSFARGDESSESDIDLRLVCGSSMTYGGLV